MRREELEILNSFGIHPAMAHGAALRMEYVGMTGKVEDAAPWRANLQIAMDAQPSLVTVANNGIPGFLTNFLDPELVRVLTAPMKAAEIYGETKKGDWVTLSTQFPVIESTGEVSSYGDHSDNGSSGANVNWVPRQSYAFQTVSQWGERELELYGLAKINYASEINVSSALVLAKAQNKSYFFGVANLQCYGMLNDPSLAADITPNTKAAGGTAWILPNGTVNATAVEVQRDITKLFAALQIKNQGVVETTDRAAVGALITMPEFVDVIVPRGGKSLIERVSRDAKVPVIKHLDGVCHVFIDIAADLDKAIRIADNAKTHRYAPCNTMETLLVHVGIADRVLPPLAAIYRDKGVELRGCERTRAILGSDVIEATEQDWYTEYTAPILSIRIVDDLDQAIEHINQYGSKHTDAIVTEHFSDARRFLNEVDSASVMVNASTRFADGFEYGLGAEIGISTDKLHARGPVGLEGLTSEKYVVFGDGHVRT